MLNRMSFTGPARMGFTGPARMGFTGPVADRLN